VNIRDAIREAETEGWRGVVLKDPGNPNRKRVYLAFDRQWEDRGDPNCLVPATFTNEELASDEWQPADDV
jgi:hypothetical protein